MSSSLSSRLDTPRPIQVTSALACLVDNGARLNSLSSVRRDLVELYVVLVWLLRGPDVLGALDAEGHLLDDRLHTPESGGFHSLLNQMYSLAHA